MKFLIKEIVAKDNGSKTTTNYGPFECDYSTIVKFKEVLDEKNRQFGVAQTIIKQK